MEKSVGRHGAEAKKDKDESNKAVSACIYIDIYTVYTLCCPICTCRKKEKGHLQAGARLQCLQHPEHVSSRCLAN